MAKPELPALTGVRFYAAVMVFLAHAPDVPGLLWLREKSLLFYTAGFIGVSFFFTLSGFVLTYNYADTFCEKVDLTAWRRFVWARISKIYPTHLLCLLITLPMQIRSPRLPLDWGAVPIHLILAQCLMPVSTPPYYTYLNFPSWSISCEFFFYLAAPVAMWLIAGKGSQRWFVWGIAIVYLGMVAAYNLAAGPMSADYFAYYFAPTRFIEFVTGVLLARLYFQQPAPLSGALTFLLAGLGIVLVCAGAHARSSLPVALASGLNYLPGTALIVYTLARSSGWIGRHLSWRPMVLLGVASFAFYMIHQPVLRIARAFFRAGGNESPELWISVVTVVACFFVAQATAFVMAFHFELPLQKRLRRWWP